MSISSEFRSMTVGDSVDWVRSEFTLLQQVKWELMIASEIISVGGPYSIACEIGSLQGATIPIYGKLLSDSGVFISIEPELEVPLDVDKISYLADWFNVVHIRHTSESPEAINELGYILDGRKIDILHIDGNHNTINVIHDFNTYKEYVRDGGVIIFHDIRWPDVNVAWNIVRDGYVFIEIYEGYSSTAGIGIIFMEDNMAIVNDSIGNPDNERNINTKEQWDSHYTEEPELLDQQLLGIYDLAVAEMDDNSTILDIGGGGGIGAAHILSKYPNSNIYVMEISQVACDVGGSRYPDIKFICADIRTVELSTGAYDYIVASQVLEHVDDLDSVMTKIMDALRPGGILYIGVPHEDDLYIWHQHRFSHESYHYFRKYSNWVSFSSDGQVKDGNIDRDMYIRLRRE